MEDLHQWFFETGKPIWRLYDGFIAGFSGRAFEARQTDDSLSMEDSWKLLEQAIVKRCHTGGEKFTIYSPPDSYRQGKPKKAGLKQHFMNGVKNMPNYTPGMGVSVSGFSNPGGNMMSMFEMWKENYELQRRVEDLEAQNGPQGFVGQIMEQIVNNIPYETIVPIVLKMLPGVGASINGAPQQVADTQAQPQGDTNTRMINAINGIAQHFENNEEYCVALEKLKQQIDTNPEMVKRFLGHE